MTHKSNEPYLKCSYKGCNNFIQGYNCHEHIYHGEKTLNCPMDKSVKNMPIDEKLKKIRKKLREQGVDYISVSKSPYKTKKIRLTYEDNLTGKLKHVDFGAVGYMDYLDYSYYFDQTYADTRRELYRNRHKGENTQGKYTPGYLSYYILW